MLCDFEQLEGFQRCRRCGRETPHPGAVRAMCRVEETGAGCLASPPKPGVGKILHELLASIGLRPLEECGCQSLAARMDAWGPAGCALHRGEILAELRERSKLIPKPEQIRAFVRAAIRGVWISPLDPAGSLLDEALRRAQSSPRSCGIFRASDRQKPPIGKVCRSGRGGQRRGSR